MMALLTHALAFAGGAAAALIAVCLLARALDPSTGADGFDKYDPD
jgi:hypothetical protein